jgi:CNT family concentrative nucleoside transporter
MTLAWTLSTDRRVVNWRVIIWGVIIQLIFALLIFVLPAGAKVFLIINDVVVQVVDVASAGAKFVFGRLAVPPGQTDEWGGESLGFIFAFQALPTVIFFASLMGLLYYMGIMSWLVRLFATVFTKLMRISGAESLCTSSNIFVGIESATTIKPYLERMTRSELCTILTAGMATIASSVLAIYVMILQQQFTTIAGHLVSASFLSAPAAIVMSKLLVPETEKPETLGLAVKPFYEKESSLIEAVINGANAGLKLVGGIIALLIAFLGLVALIDLILTGFGLKLNSYMGINVDWSLKALLGYVFYPFTLIIGVPYGPCRSGCTRHPTVSSLCLPRDICPLRICPCRLTGYLRRRYCRPCSKKNGRPFIRRSTGSPCCNPRLPHDCSGGRDIFFGEFDTVREINIGL